MSLDELLETWETYLARRQWEQALADAQSRGDATEIDEAKQRLANPPPITPLEALRANAEIVRILSVQRWIAMNDAREQGATLEQIGSVLGISRQSAWEFIQRKINEHQMKSTAHEEKRHDKE